MKINMAWTSLLVALAVMTGTAWPDEVARWNEIAGKAKCAPATATLLASGLQGASGSTIGPGGALYVTEGKTGNILRIDPQTGEKSVFATGLPKAVIPIGGAYDLTFIGSTAFVLVTLVGPDVGGQDVVGIYRVDGPSAFTVIADIGKFSIANPPADFVVPSGVQYAIEPYRNGFLVTDGNHNRVLFVTHNGRIKELITLGNEVPTGLAISGRTIFLALAGPVPHNPEDGKVVAFTKKSGTPTVVASGARLAVDVEFGRGRTLFALAQGVFGGGNPGAPALPNTGSLLRVNAHGTVTVVKDQLDRPTSMEIIGNTAYVVTLGGEIWKIGNTACPPYGRWD